MRGGGGGGQHADRTGRARHRWDGCWHGPMVLEGISIALSFRFVHLGRTCAIRDGIRPLIFSGSVASSKSPPSPYQSVVCMAAQKSSGDRARHQVADDCDLSGFPSAAWTTLLDRYAIVAMQSAQPLTLALPCIGTDTCSQALVDLRVPFAVKYAYDIQACLARPLTALHGNINHFHLGHIDGDLLAADVHAWERVDGVVAGPPCPPWSQCGKRGSWTDPRAQVFWKVSDIIIDQGHKGARFFILEMVPGMDEMHSRNDRTRHSTPFAD